LREGDVPHSQADISKAAALLGYEPQFDIRRGLDAALAWYCEHLA
jgi:UDP-N-acetylglucosamine 4-epimerase